jgi:hypothetical protein
LVIQLADDIKVAPQQLALKRDAVSRISRPFPKQFLKAIQRLSGHVLSTSIVGLEGVEKIGRLPG